uniref:Uncharacterized protein n=1 Tax=Lepeophtheirus salmonis TaxID=72036 RepID=A0A0K2U7S5_LEPSM
MWKDETVCFPQKLAHAIQFSGSFSNL